MLLKIIITVFLIVICLTVLCITACVVAAGKSDEYASEIIGTCSNHACNFTHCNYNCEGTCKKLDFNDSCNYYFLGSLCSFLVKNGNWNMNCSPKKAGMYYVMAQDTYSGNIFMTQLAYKENMWNNKKKDKIIAWNSTFVD